MAAEPISTYALNGRIVTMGPDGVIDDGTIYVHQGMIEAVRPARVQPPDTKYADAPLISTGDTLYPGLIELHNHLSYNAMPLWDVPQKYSNNGQWRGTERYTRDITKPSQVLGQTPGVAQALVRYAESRALLGGVTTSQGITLASAGGLTKYYDGLVRNVESPTDPRLPGAGTKIANPSTGGARSYLDNNLTDNTCYLQHLAEGIDQTARGWFLRLQIDDEEWAVNDVLCGIHCTALDRADFEVLARGGASIVWSPLSNYLLYGETTDIASAKAAGVLVSLGCDWAPSGSKNLLGELKVARLASRHAGDVFTNTELVAMVTINPARAVKWDHLLGSLEAGRLADVVAVNGRSGDPYEQLIEARETSLTMVLIGGVPRAGQYRLMRRFWPGEEIGSLAGVDRYEIDRSVRYLYVSHEGDILEGLTLTDAIGTLADGMHNLPQLAVEVDNAVGSVMGADGSLNIAGGIESDDGERWRVVPDFEADDVAMAQDAGPWGEFLLGAEPYSHWVTAPIELDPITVAQDEEFVRALVRAPNVPEYVRKGLPAEFGMSIPVPDSVGFVHVAGVPVAEQVKTTAGELSEFLRLFGELTLDERRLIVDQALLVLQDNYVHLPLKQAMYAVNPIQALRLLRYRLDDMTPDEMPLEIDFHAELTAIFNSLRDLHTGYRLPEPFNSKVAWLPFLIEEVYDGGRSRFVLTKWVTDTWPDDGMKGATVTHWNGMPIDKAVARNAERQAGGNPDARRARGINSLTIRPLARGLPPDEDWVTIRWLDSSGTSREHTQKWLVFERGGGIGPQDLLAEAAALGVDDLTDDVQEARKVLFAPEIAEAEQRAVSQQLDDAMLDATADLASFMPGVFRAKRVAASASDGPEYGYIRIFTFNVSDADGFVDEFVRLSEMLPRNGLIIDVRGNGGGLIYAAEQLLDVLTPRTIEPERAQFINTPLNLRICRRNAPSQRLEGLNLHDWVESMRLAIRTGATYSIGFPITPPEKTDRLGQRYHGPVVVVTDPLCYSATDMFAAGFQDHRVGTIIGVGGATGAGGANVWPHRLLRMLTEPDLQHQEESPYKALPHGADVRVAVRRTTRVGERSGAVLEDLGVEPDIRYHMTSEDVIGQNQGLVDRAIVALSAQEPRWIDVAEPPVPDDPRLRVKLQTHNVERVETSVDHRGLLSRDVVADEVAVELADVVEDRTSGPLRVKFVGYVGRDVVAERRSVFELA